MTRPRAEKIAVMTANPDGGIGTPEMAELIPTAWPAAATRAVATAATTAAVTPTVSSEPSVGPAEEVVREVVVLDTAFLR